VDLSLVELAEDAGLWMPPDPHGETIVGDGYVLVVWGRRGSVEHVRLGDVETAVGEVRALARDRGVTDVVWWVGDLATPDDLAAQLTAQGLALDADEPELTSLTLSSPPVGVVSGDVRLVDSFAGYLLACELDWEVFKVSDDDRRERRALARERWESLLVEKRVSHYLAYVDGEPVGFGRVVFTPLAGLLMGGAVLPAARGRGLYGSLVDARWNEAAERGTPRLVVGAGAMSAPILLKLGFERIGAIRVLSDRLDAGASG
jgi:hypothetical protein